MNPTREQVIAWAREAGYETDRGPLLAKHASIKVGGLCVGLHPMLDRFAALAYTAGREAGLERAAEVCDEWATKNHVYVNGAIRCGKDIRALKGEKE